MSIKFEEVQKNISSIANRESYDKDFIFELMAAYGRSSASITKLRQGDLNLAEDKESEVIQRGVIYFKSVSRDTVLFSISDSLKQSPLTARFNPRYIIVTDFENLVAIDTKKSNTTLSCKIRDLDRNVDFFWAWTGEEKIDEKTEAVADKKAAEKMKQLYEEIEKVNSQSLERDSIGYRHELNLFFTRLLFCFFAEDTRVFSRDEKSLFTNSIKDFTQLDGSDLDTFLSKLFFSLNTDDKSNIDSPFSKFPYVNGSLFDINKRKITIPKFNAQARKIILECGSLNWAEINPDIFGSMFQGIVEENHRETHGMHYTSVTNILKTLDPLFLDEIREDFDKNFNNSSKLQKLLLRISKIKVFDPACGSGNFLIIAYKELRKIEHAILQNLLSDKIQVKLSSVISLDNFYGIEIDDFAHEIAILSLYIAKHQMNVIFEEQFGKEIKLIPLTDKANIVLGNAAVTDWNKVCPNISKIDNFETHTQGFLLDVEPTQSAIFKSDTSSINSYDEIYLVGNPPYRGSKLQNKSQKDDFKYFFENNSYPKNLDYISIWFLKGAQYISGTRAQLAFVSTNSICQGEHVGILFPYIKNFNLEIGFAYTSFRWVNSAKGNAGVYCIILNLRNPSKNDKYIYTDNIKKTVKYINYYLVESNNEIIIKRRGKPISSLLPKMSFGNMPIDGGNFLLDISDYNLAVSQGAERYLKRFFGAAEFIRGLKRWCIWIEEEDISEALKVPFIYDRVQKVKEFRLRSLRKETKLLAEKPYKFGFISYKKSNSLIVPRVTSELRDYIPFGFLSQDNIISDSANVIYNSEIWLFGLISSRIHMVWVKAVAGRLKSDLRYSSELVYNNFPFPDISIDKLEVIKVLAKNILFLRENYSNKSLSQLYNPKTMPHDLKKAHYDLDIFIDSIYRDKPFDNDQERLSVLFSMYEEMIKNQTKK